MMSNSVGRPKPGHSYCGNNFLHTLILFVEFGRSGRAASADWLTSSLACSAWLSVAVSSVETAASACAGCLGRWLVGCRRRKELSSTLSSSKAQGNDRQQYPTQLLDIGETSDFFGLKSKFYKKRGATFFYDITRKLGPLDFTQYRSKSSSF